MIPESRGYERFEIRVSPQPICSFMLTTSEQVHLHRMKHGLQHNARLQSWALLDCRTPLESDVNQARKQEPGQGQ